MTKNGIARIALMLATTLTAGACGLKGDLYVPEPEGAQQSPSAPAVDGDGVAEDESAED